MGAPAQGNGGLRTPSLSTQRHRAQCRTDHFPLTTMVTGEATASCWSAWTLWACTASHPVRHFVCQWWYRRAWYLDGVRFLLLYKYSWIRTPRHRRSALGEKRNFGVSTADSSYLVTFGPRGLWSSMRHLDYCGVWSPGEYFRVRTSLFHCRDFDILDAYLNIFSTCHLSRFLLPPFGPWTRAEMPTCA